MNKQNQFCIIGTGAVGGYYGGLLQKAGFDVHFLLNTDYNHVSKNGLRVDSVNGNFRLPDIHAYDDPKEMPLCEVIIIALKTTANDALEKILPHLLKKDTIILTLQNGLGNDEIIAALAGADRVIGGLCFLCSNKIAPGHIQHLDYGLITIGEYRADGSPGGITPRLEKLGNDLKSADIPIRLVEDLSLAQWKKLVWNIPFNGLSVVHNVLTDQLVKNPDTRMLCETIMLEVAAASAACARPIEQSFIDKMIADTERMEPYAPSMKLDFDRGHPMELEAIYDRPIRLARSKGINMPCTEKLYQQLLTLDSRS